MGPIFIVLTVVLTLHRASCSIDGVSYMDAIIQRRRDQSPKEFPRGEDPCNPLYWYPKAIPEECPINRTVPIKPPPSVPLPVPLPVPQPYPQPMPMPSMPMPGPLLPMPMPMPIPPLPYGIPIVPSSPMLPVAAQPYPFSYPNPYQMPLMNRPGPQMGMVPGIPDLVSPDGGINILPFSDVYADILEKRKMKLARRRMERVLDAYDDYPRSRRNYRKRKMFQKLYDATE